jgi:hypothetical protein
MMGDTQCVTQSLASEQRRSRADRPPSTTSARGLSPALRPRRDPARFPSRKICVSGPSRAILRTGDAKRRPGLMPHRLCWDCSAPRRIPSITLKVCSGSRATRVIACDRRRAFAQETETATLRADRFDQLLCLQICLRAEMSNSSESLGWLFSTALDNRSAPTIPLSSATARCRASRLSPLIRAANISR